MKKTFFTLVLFSLLAFAVAAQGPQAPKYHALVRNAEGRTLAKQSVRLKVSLLQFGIVYSETHTDSTDALGLVELPVGKGSPTFGKFDTIRWEQRPTYIQISLATDGANYELMGLPELFNVSGAFYASNALPGKEKEGDLPAGKKGDLLYRTGAGWQHLPAGVTGEELAMGADGKPFWQAPMQIAFFLKVPLPNGEVMYACPREVGPLSWGPEIDITALPNIGLDEALNDFSGETNTAAIVAQLGNNAGDAYAAKLCADLVAFGYDDWYLPAAGELIQMSKILPSELEYWSSSENWNPYYLQSGILHDDYAKINPDVQCRCVRR